MMVYSSLMFSSLVATLIYRRYVTILCLWVELFYIRWTFLVWWPGFCFSMFTTTLVAFDSIQIYTIVGRCALVFLIHGMVRRTRSGSHLCQPCYKFWYLYKRWSWMKSLTLMSLVMQVQLARHMVNFSLKCTMRVHFFYHWRRCCTQWGDPQRYVAIIIARRFLLDLSNEHFLLDLGIWYHVCIIRLILMETFGNMF